MSRPDIRRILVTCLNNGAKEVFLLAGRPPLLRYGDCVRELQIEPLAADDVLALAMDSLIPREVDRQEMHEWYDKNGFCRWDYPYYNRRDTRFRVFIIRNAQSDFAILTPIGPDVPEMEYATA